MALIEVLHSVRFEFDLNDRLQGLLNAVSLFLSGGTNKIMPTCLTQSWSMRDSSHLSCQYSSISQVITARRTITNDTIKHFTRRSPNGAIIDCTNREPTPTLKAVTRYCDQCMVQIRSVATSPVTGDCVHSRLSSYKALGTSRWQPRSVKQLHESDDVRVQQSPTPLSMTSLLSNSALLRDAYVHHWTPIKHTQWRTDHAPHAECLSCAQ